jgi:predicted ATPase
MRANPADLMNHSFPFDKRPRQSRPPYFHARTAFPKNTVRKVRRGEYVPKLPIAQRRFAAPSDAIIWTRDLQATAVAAGVFLRRVLPHNCVYVHNLVAGDEIEASEQIAMDALEALAFRNDAFAQTALAFIEQQDKYGWSGTWEPAVETFQKTMRWLQEYHRVYEVTDSDIRRRRAMCAAAVKAQAWRQFMRNMTPDELLPRTGKFDKRIKTC